MPLDEEDFESGLGEVLVKATVPAPDTSTVYNTDPKVPVKVTIAGDPLQTTYFSQLLGETDHPQSLDLFKSPALQQYTKIINFEIMVTDSLNGSANENVITEVTASATVYPTIAPNVGDMFTARMSDRRIGLFTVTEVTKSKYYNTAAYDITYALFALHNEAYEKNLTDKTINVLYFDPENPYTPGRSAEALTQRVDYAALCHKLLLVWYKVSYDKLTSTALVPNTDGVIGLYDPAIVRFMKRLLPSKLSELFPSLTYYPMPTKEGTMPFTTVWDVLIDNETTMMGFIDRMVGSSSITEYRSRYNFSGAGFVPVRHVLLPTSETPAAGYSVDATGDTYVFSPAFYDQVPTEISPLETLVWAQLEGSAPNREKLEEEVTETLKKDAPTLFYRIPVLLWLLLQNM